MSPSAMGTLTNVVPSGELSEKTAISGVGPWVTCRSRESVSMSVVRLRATAWSTPLSPRVTVQGARSTAVDGGTASNVISTYSFSLGVKPCPTAEPVYIMVNEPGLLVSTVSTVGLELSEPEFTSDLNAS